MPLTMNFSSLADRQDHTLATSGKIIPTTTRKDPS